MYNAGNTEANLNSVCNNAGLYGNQFTYHIGGRCYLEWNSISTIKNNIDVNPW